FAFPPNSSAVPRTRLLTLFIIPFRGGTQIFTTNRVTLATTVPTAIAPFGAPICPQRGHFATDRISDSRTWGVQLHRLHPTPALRRLHESVHSLVQRAIQRTIENGGVGANLHV